MAGGKLRTARPKGNAVLRKLIQPIFDTTVLEGNPAVVNQLQFYRIPKGGAMPVAGGIKSEADTNLNKAGAIGAPDFFLLEGFQFEWFILEPDDVDDTADDLVDLYEQSLFTFEFGLNRIWYQFPLSQLPCGPNVTGTAASGDITNNTEWGHLHQGIASVHQSYSVLVDKEPVEIGSEEPFNVRIDWTNGAITFDSANDQRCRMFMLGMLCTGL